MGRLSAAHIAAVGVGGMIFNFIYWNFGFLRMGTTGMTAQAYGAEDSAKQANIFIQSCLVGVSLSLLLVFFAEPLISASTYLMNIDGSHADLVISYFKIRIWDAPATMLFYSILGWFFGMQNAIFPLILTIFINVFNVVLSYILVTHYHMAIEGVAWGTVIAQYVGMLVALGMLYFRYRDTIVLGDGPFAQSISELKNYLTVNRDIFIRTLCLTLAFGVFYSQSAKLGDDILAANVVLLLFANWMSHAIDGFAYATESIVGKYVGIGDESRTRSAIRLLFRWAAGAAVLITILYWLAADQLTAIFIGLTAVKAMRNAMLAAFLLYLPALFLGSQYWGNHGIWLALTLLMIFRGGIQTWMYQRHRLQLQ